MTYTSEFVMPKILFCIIIAVILGSFSIFGQNDHSGYRLKGRITNQKSEVIPALSLSVKNDRGTSGTNTDVNGDFEIDLLPGDYEITSPELIEADFRLFLKIVEKEPNPQNLELVADTSLLCKKRIDGVIYPSVLKSVIPKVPGYAVRAIGTVAVMLSVDSDGKGISAKSVSGHPLLKPTSEAAAKQFEFEPSDNKDVRSIVISFIFIDSGAPKLEVNRFECPFRIVVERPSLKINI